jgi:hypothetical protein
MRAPLAGVVAAWLASGAVPALGISDAGPLCPADANPCVVDRAFDVADGAVLDVGPRTLEVTATGRLDVGVGTMTVSAGALVIRADGRLLGNGGKIFVKTSGAIQMEATSRIDASGPLGGLINLQAGAEAAIAGVLDAHSTGPADGGLVAVNAAAVTLSVSARVLVSGDPGAGGNVSLFATGSLVVDAPLDAEGAESGGAIECDAASIVLNGRIDVSGGPGGAGAIIDLRSRGGVVVNGVVDGDARGGVLTGGGLGAEVSILAQGPVDLNGRMELSGGAPGGEGGLVDILTTGDVTQRGAIEARGIGSEGVGGEVRVTTDGGVTLGDIDMGGGYAANRVVVASKGIVRLTGAISGEPATAQGFGGVVEVTACALDMDSIAVVSTRGKEGRNSLTASGQMILRGTLAAGQQNVLTVRDAAIPPLILGSISPAPTTAVDPNLPPCDAEPGPGSTTTTTIPVGECADPLLAPYDALLCRLSAIEATLANAGTASLGGARTARSLRRRADRTLRAVEIARSGRRVAKKLGVASRQLGIFLNRVRRGLESGRVDATIGARLLDLGTTAGIEIESLRP